MWWLLPAILAFQRRRKEDLCDFRANPGYTPLSPGHLQLELRTCLRKKEFEEDGSANTALSATPDDLSLVCRTHVVEGEA